MREYGGLYHKEAAMISLAQLWLPILVAAIAVFAASSVIHMFVKWHNTDYLKLGNEDDVRAVIRAGHAGTGQYVIPYCSDPKEMQKPEMLQKFKEGPVGFLVLRPPCEPSMGKPLGLWFLLNLVVALLAGYLACRTLAAGSSFLQICRMVGIVTFAAYACGSAQQAIWMGKPWGSAGKEIADALIYAIVSALVFGWLWPR
jgi:hypothetical protein